MKTDTSTDWIENTDQNPFWRHKDGAVLVQMKDGRERTLDCPGCLRSFHLLVARWKPMARTEPIENLMTNFVKAANEGLLD